MKAWPEDLSFPTAPAELGHWVHLRSRDAAVLVQAADVDLDWWNGRLDRVPGGPVSSRRGEYSGEVTLRRSDVYALADDAVDDDTGAGAVRSSPLEWCIASA